MFLRPLFFFFLLASVLSADESVFEEGSKWELVSDDHQFAEGMEWDADGNFIFTDVPRGQLFRVDKRTGEKTLLDGDTGRANGIAFGPDGRLYGCSSEDEGINAWDPKTWKKTTLGAGVLSNDIAILDDGTIFFTDPRSKAVWRLSGKGYKREKAADLPWNPNGITLSPDQKTLLVAEFNSDTIHGFPIARDRNLGKGSPAYKLAVPTTGAGRLDGMFTLPDGRLLSGTELGLQIAHPLKGGAPSGTLIIEPSPEGRPRCNYVRMSPDGKWLYTAYAKDVLRRKLSPSFAAGGR